MYRIIGHNITLLSLVLPHLFYGNLTTVLRLMPLCLDNDNLLIPSPWWYYFPCLRSSSIQLRKCIRKLLEVIVMSREYICQTIFVWDMIEISRKFKG